MESTDFRVRPPAGRLEPSTYCFAASARRRRITFDAPAPSSGTTLLSCRSSALTLRSGTRFAWSGGYGIRTPSPSQSALTCNFPVAGERLVSRP
jgi:hypothetical protein